MVEEKPVIVVDVRMKFWSMVILLIKLAFASIPAAIVLTVTWAGLAMIFRGVLGLAH